MAVRNGYNSTRRWAARRANRQALARFAEFWQALQEVGDTLAEAQRAAKNAEAGAWRERNQRHWAIAGVDEIRSALRGCKFSLRVVRSWPRAGTAVPRSAPPARSPPSGRRG